jgi:hypothetical protein
MSYSGLWRCVPIVRTRVSEERIASIIWVERINDLGTTLTVLVAANVVHSSLILSTLMMDVISSFEMPVLIIPTRRHILKDSILLNSYNKNYGNEE